MNNKIIPALKAGIFLLPFFFFVKYNFSQNLGRSISGYIYDSLSNEPLINATIYNLDLNTYAISNGYGFYQLHVNNKDTVVVTVAYLGYEKKEITVCEKNNTFINVYLIPLHNAIEEVVVSANSIIHHQPGIVSIPIATMKQMPITFGERDVLKIVQMLPGVNQGIEGTAGIFVRGGGSDQNLILIDDAPVYNISHLFGFFSLFTPEALSDVTMIKSSFPAKYGERASSILEIRMKEGNAIELKGVINIGLISNKIFLEGPIMKDKISFMISARRTFFDILFRPFLTSYVDNTKSTTLYNFYDLNGKVNFNINPSNKIFLSFYSGKDKLKHKYSMTSANNGKVEKEKSSSNMKWGNNTLTARYNKIFSNHMFSNTSVILSHYSYLLGQEESAFYSETGNSESINDEMSFYSTITDYCFKTDFSYVCTNHMKIEAGALSSFKTFKPFFAHYSSSKNTRTNKHSGENNTPIYTFEINPYASLSHKIADFFKYQAGLRATHYYTNNTLDVFVQPRITADFILSKTKKITTSLSRMVQNIHLLSNTGIGMPSDLYVPATHEAPVQIADQLSVGYLAQIKQNYDFSCETYYKKMTNVVAYKEGADLLNSDENWYDKIVSGKGEAYGMEMMMKKNGGRLTGWASYTLSWSNRQFENINGGNKFAYKYDRRNNFKAVAIIPLKKNISFSGTWVFMDGIRATFPLLSYPISGSEPQYEIYNSVSNVSVDESRIDYIPQRNNIKLKPYHRLDVSLQFRKEKVKTIRTWCLSVYNLYMQKNPLFYHYDNTQKQLVQVALFPIIPSISCEIQF